MGIRLALEVSKVVLVELRPVLESIGKIGSILELKGRLDDRRELM